MRHITGNRAQRKADGGLVTPRTQVVQEEVGTQLAMNYIGRQQGAVAQWVELQTIFEICAGEKGYEGGGSGGTHGDVKRRRKHS